MTNPRRPGRVTAAVMTLLLIAGQTLAVPAGAQGLPGLPAPGTRVSTTARYTPTTLAGMTLHPEDPFLFDFIVRPGDDHLQCEAFQNESTKLIRYFLAALTVPENDLWVNLSPYEQDRIIPDGFGDTEMGRDLLAQDYLLKQLTASLLSPEDDLGSDFWQRVYQRAREEYGTTEIPMNTFNKVWIVPDQASVAVEGTSVYVVNSHHQVMLEEDYLALEMNQGHARHGVGDVREKDLREISALSKEVIREIILPEIEREVNEGQGFANLRQITNAVILATWYKRHVMGSVLSQHYTDQNKTQGIDTQDKQINQKIYQQYVEAFRTGVLNVIKEEYDPVRQAVIPRKYFSGGVVERQGEIVTKRNEKKYVRNEVNGSWEIGVRLSLAPDDYFSSASLSEIIVKASDFARIDINRTKVGRFKTQYNDAIARRTPTSYTHRIKEPFDVKNSYLNITKGEVIKTAVLSDMNIEILANIRPYVEGHFLLIPDRLKQLVQYIDDIKYIRIVMAYLHAANDPRLRFMYHSFGTGASMNHLHFQGFFYGDGSLPIEDVALTKEITIGAVSVFLGKDYPTPVVRFSSEDYSELSEILFDFIRILNKRGIAHKILFTKNKIIVSLRSFINETFGAEKGVLGDLGGEFFVSSDAREVSERELEEVLSKNALNDADFEGVLQEFMERQPGARGLISTMPLAQDEKSYKKRPGNDRRLPFLVSTVAEAGLPWEGDAGYQDYQRMSGDRDYFSTRFATWPLSLWERFFSQDPRLTAFFESIDQDDRAVLLGFGLNFPAHANQLYHFANFGEIIGVDWLAENVNDAMGYYDFFKDRTAKELAKMSNGLGEDLSRLLTAFRREQVDIGLYQADIANMERLADNSVKLAYGAGMITVDPDSLHDGSKEALLAQLREILRVLQVGGRAVLVNWGIGPAQQNGGDIIRNVGILDEDLKDLGVEYTVFDVGNNYGVLILEKTAATPAPVSSPGGIDLNPRNMAIQESGEDAKIYFPPYHGPVPAGIGGGLVPVILHISPPGSLSPN